MTNKTNGIALVVILAILLVGTTVSLAPMNVMGSSGGSSGDTIPALRQSNVIEMDAEVKHDKLTVSDEHSSNAAEVDRDRTIKIDKDLTDDPANSWERTINTPNKVIEQSGSSNEESSKGATSGGSAGSAAAAAAASAGGSGG